MKCHAYSCLNLQVSARDLIFERYRRCTPNQKAQVTGRILGTNSLSQETMKYVAEAIMYADGFLASVADPRP